MKHTFVLISSLCLLSQSPATAGEFEVEAQPGKNNGSFYGTLGGGVAFFQGGRVDVKKNPSGAADFDLDTGSTVSLNLGYDFGSFRLEGEFNHSQAGIPSLDTDTGSVSVDSQFSSNGVMANALWDFDFKPFVLSAGVGVGFSMVKYDQMDNSGFIAVAESEGAVFSGQLILNASYNLNEHTTLGIGYRYLMVSGLDDNGYVDTGGSGKSDISFDGLGASMVELFFNYRF